MASWTNPDTSIRYRGRAPGVFPWHDLLVKPIVGNVAVGSGSYDILIMIGNRWDCCRKVIGSSTNYQLASSATRAQVGKFNFSNTDREYENYIRSPMQFVKCCTKELNIFTDLQKTPWCMEWLVHCVRKDRSGRERLEEHNKDEISSLWWLRRPNQHSLKAESGAFVHAVTAVPIFVQLHWFRLVQLGSDWFRMVQIGSD